MNVLNLVAGSAEVALDGASSAEEPKAHCLQNVLEKEWAQKLKRPYQKVPWILLMVLGNQNKEGEMDKKCRCKAAPKCGVEKCPHYAYHKPSKRCQTKELCVASNKNVLCTRKK